MTAAIRSRTLPSILAVTCCVLGLVMLAAPSVGARTPLRSPEQLARDEVLFAHASQMIASQAMRCFKPPQGRNAKPFKVRFFVSRAGKRSAQFSVLDASDVARPARSARERAAVGAIKACAPYSMPEELRAWGGFWVTVAF